MTLLSAVRDLLRTRDASAESNPVDDVPADPGAEAPLPFAGYADLNDRDVIQGLSDHSQVELEAVEGYERSHKDREPVLDKLRYMRGREPVAGYDALTVEEILAALGDADLATVKKVRTYERKFGKRPDVLDAVVQALHRRQETEPASAAPAYQSASAKSAS